MRGIIKRGNTYKWDITVHGQRRYGYAKTEELAYQARERARKAILDGEAPVDTHTLGGMITLLLATEWTEENRKAHYWIKQMCTYLIRYFGRDTPLAAIDTEAIERYVVHLRKVEQNSNATINRKIYTLSKILRRAREHKVISDLPIIRKQREPQGRLRFLSDTEENAILTYFRSKDNYTIAWMIEVLIDTGMREGELFKLTIYDVDWTKGKHGIVILKDTKNGDTRSVPLTERAKRALLDLESTSSDNLHFTPRNLHWLTKQWNQMKKDLGLEHDVELVPHALRHTCASRLVQRGAPLYTVSKWLGHHNMNTTKRYAHLRPEELYELTNLLEPDD